MTRLTSEQLVEIRGQYRAWLEGDVPFPDEPPELKTVDIVALLAHITALGEELQRQEFRNGELKADIEQVQRNNRRFQEELQAAQETIAGLASDCAGEVLRESLIENKAINDFRARLVEAVRQGSDGVGGDFQIGEIVQLIQTFEARHE